MLFLLDEVEDGVLVWVCCKFECVLCDGDVWWFFEGDGVFGDFDCFGLGFFVEVDDVYFGVVVLVVVLE